MPLRDHVRIARRFQRAIRIDSDLSDPEALEGFICPRSSAEILLTMGRHVAETGQAAFTWTGPYGSGKSSLVIALSALLGGEIKKRNSAAQIIGRQTASQLWKLLPPFNKGWRVLPVVGRREPPAVVIGEALVSAGFTSKRGRSAWSESRVLDTLTNIAAETPRQRGGLIIFIDEMGKFLEGAAAENADIYLFQQLAELAARSDHRLIVVGILHQAFEGYAHRLAREQRDEWAKVQGRFIDLVVNTAGEEQLEVLARAIESERRPRKPSPAVHTVARCISANHRGGDSSLAATLERCWPLHPLVAALLGPISRRRFGQNQRSLFGFLNSAEPNGFQDFLRDADDAALYTPDKLWDYLRINLEPSILASPDGHRWSLAVEAIERCEGLGGDELHLLLLKALALIDLFKERSGLLATTEILSECAYGYGPKQTKTALHDLVTWSLVLFKRHLGAYAIYAGSDFDIDQALSEALEEIKEINFQKLRSVAAFHPVIAKRHYHETGALRWFDVDLVPSGSIISFITEYKQTRGSMGIFLIPIPTEQESITKLKRLCHEAANISTEADIIVGHSPQAGRVVELAREVLALAQIQQERPELAGDGVARRELLARLAEAQDQLERLLSQILDGAAWYRHKSKGESYSSAGLSALASEIADERFSRAPRIYNELLNRLKPSTNAAAAQKALLQAMVLKAGEARLGIEGFPAEGGLFASLLEATGLYRKTEDGWQFVAPGTNDTDPANLGPLWQQADHLLQQGAGRVTGLEELYDAWRVQPHGVKNGLMPILAVAYILSRRDNLALYRQNIFQARFTDLDIDYLAKDPRDIQLRWLDLNEETQHLLLGMADIVRKLDENQRCIALKPIDIARGLVAAYEALEFWTKRTARLSAEAIRIRDILKHASDPNRLLLDDLPALVGANTDLANKHAVSQAVAAVGNGLQELRTRYKNMLDELRKLLFKELHVLDASKESIALLRERAKNVRDVSGDFRLNAFIGRIAQFQGVDADIEGLASLAANKPPRDWTDPDLNQAALELASFAQQFIRTEAFARVKGRRDKRHSMAVVVGFGSQPTPASQEFSVTDADRSAIEDLIYRVELTLRQADQQQKHVILAALAELSARFMSKTVEHPPKKRRAV
jgi:hypothetical protein